VPFRLRLAVKLAKSANKGKKLALKYFLWVTKIAEFHADFRSVEKGS
jgi:hypothetical protein